MSLRVAIIGWGAIGQVVVEELLKVADVDLAAVVVRQRQFEDARTSLPSHVRVVTAAESLLAERPDIVIECAGQAAVRDYGQTVLSSRANLMVASVGALADEELFHELKTNAAKAQSQILIPAGAIAGLDGLGALRMAGLNAVTYTSIKPPRAWIGTDAEKRVDLAALRAPTTFFEGTARAAALAYPKNANLAATVGLAGIGLDKTAVRLVADPDAAGNTGMIEASSAIGEMKVVMANAASANPKTSANTAYSLLHAICVRTAAVAV